MSFDMQSLIVNLFPFIHLLFTSTIAIHAFHSASPFLKQSSQLITTTQLRNFASSATKTLQKRNVKIPLFLPGEGEKTTIPLPASHLPPEIATLNLYGILLSSPSHVRMIEESKSSKDVGRGDIIGRFGYVVAKNPHFNSDDDHELVGAVGCAIDVLIAETRPASDSDPDPTSPKMALLARGSFRFVVKSIESSFPFPTAIVDELLDYDDNRNDSGVIYYDDFGTDDDVEEDIYMGMDTSTLTSRCIEAMESIISTKLSEPEPTLLEKSILEDVGLSPTAASSNAEEMAAVMPIFKDELIDMTDRVLRRYAVGMMAAEIAGVENDIRQEIITTRDGVERLRTVLRILDEKVSHNRAKKITQKISEESEEGDVRQLKVGKPKLPPWVDNITPGMRVEYYWNEEYEWCAGTVKEIIKVLDELIIVFKFDVDGEEHRLPFLPEEKARWRPVQ